MKTYNVTIQFITDYLQARFTEDAKKELENYVSQGIVKSEEESWKTLLHFDEQGIYVPNTHFRNALVNAGGELKLKKQRKSLKQWVISNIMVNPEQIHLEKQEPDKVITSYPMRKDGNRVTIKHPAINKGTSVQFTISVLSDMEDKTIRQLVDVAGKNYGIGARRRDMFGRFEVVQFS
jgi:hypothetical protein